MACDGYLAVDRLNSVKPIKPTKAHYDLLAAIQAIQAKLPIKTIIQHVKGPQDSGEMTMLTRVEWMNAEMDAKAK